MFIIIVMLLMSSIGLSKNVYAETLVFKDVPATHWATKEIQFLTGKNIIQGLPDGRFAPDASLTRLQIALIIARAKGYQLTDRPDPHLLDVKYEDESFGVISAVMAEGIFQDVVKGEEFLADAFVTRAEMASILARAYGLTGFPSTQFKDAREDHWAYRFIQAVVKNQIVFGFQDQTFRPDQTLTRAQFAVMMARTIDASFRVVPEPPKKPPVQEIYQKALSVPVVKQKPELPNGCEITSLTAVLKFYGFSVSKMEMANTYLPKEPFVYKNGKRYGPNPYKAYAGDPRLKTGFFSYAPPIVKAAEKYFKGRTTKYTAKDISGSKQEIFYQHLNNGVPVVIWVTLDLSKPKVTSSWYFSDTKEHFKAPVNLHAVVLTGYDKKKNTVQVMNPLKGMVTQDADKFFKSYKELGSHAMIVEKN